MDELTRIMIAAGEASGDLHGANLVRALRALHPSPAYEFFGLGGIGMAKAGVRIVYPAHHLASIGPIEAIPKLRRYYQCWNRLVEEAATLRPQLVILVDFPEFNLRLAKKLKSIGLRVVYYISPQIWAWRQSRVEKIRKYVDKMLVVLPFEKDFYQTHGIEVSYVGHPLVRPYSYSAKNASSFRREFAIASDQKLIALLPGSRPREVKYILPPLLDAARRIGAQAPATFLLAVTDSVPRNVYSNLLAAFRSGSPVHAAVPVKLITGRTQELLAVSDLAVVKSGTATLEAILAEIPFLIVYRISWLSFLIGKCLVQAPHYGLPNLIAGRRVVPELIQGAASPARIADQILHWLSNPEEMARVKRDLVSLKESMGSADASQEAARVISEFLSPNALTAISHSAK